MARTDPRQRYWETNNIQCTTARKSNANMLAYVDILSQPLTPLGEQDLENLHPWLLEGGREEALTIYGGTGVSPKLLHVFGQITELCVMLGKDLKSTMLVHGADGIQRVIKNLRQTSEASEGYSSPEDLLAATELNLDSSGLVNNEKDVTDLTAEAWRQAALIYLRCRFFR
jgi:Fungal specific transcription factor domain